MDIYHLSSAPIAESSSGLVGTYKTIIQKSQVWILAGSQWLQIYLFAEYMALFLDSPTKTNKQTNKKKTNKQINKQKNKKTKKQKEGGWGSQNNAILG